MARHENLSVNKLRVTKLEDTHGNEVTGAISPAGNVLVFDDFKVPAGDNIDTLKWTWAGDTETSAVVASQNGDVEITTSATDNAGASLIAANSALCSYGNLFMETRLFLKTDVANIAVFAGFTDVATIEEPLLNSGTTCTAEAGDAVGFLYDTDSTVDDWMYSNVIATTVTTPAIHTGSVPVAGTYITIRVELDKTGNATLFLNGSKAGYVAGAITAADPMFPAVVVHNRSAASNVVTVDYMMYGHDRV